MPCWADPRPVTHYRGLFWPGIEVISLFAPTVSKHGVKRSEVMDLMERDPATLLAFGENAPNVEADATYRTVATYAVGVTGDGLLEIALRQNLSYEWMESCDKYNLRVLCCYVFHARYLD